MKSFKKYIVLIIIVSCFVFSFYAYFILGNQLRAFRGVQKGIEYTTKMYNDYAVAGKSCQGEDSDNNGYVTCNFRLTHSTTRTERTITLQCPTFFKSFLATSCKEQGIMINNQ
jgi:hypothetical protein